MTHAVSFNGLSSSWYKATAWQRDAPCGEKVPSAQAEHDDAPASGAYLPGPHSTQFLPVSAFFPFAHEVHAGDAAAEIFPASQVEQEVDPEPDEY